MSAASFGSGRHLAGGVLRVFLSEALVIPTGFVITIYLARRLGPEGFGLFTLTALLVSWIELCITSLFSRTTIKFVSDAKDWKPVGTAVLRLDLALSISAAVLLWIFSRPLSQLLHEPSLAFYLQVFSLDIPIFSLSRAHRDILVGKGEFGKRALGSVGYWLSRMVLIIGFVELGLSVPGAILGSIGASLVELAIGRLFVQPSFFGPAAPLRQFLGYSLPLFFSALVFPLYRRLDLFMLKMLGATIQMAGVYGVGQRMSAISGIFVTSFSPLLVSTLARTFREDDPAKAKEMGHNALRVVIGLLPFVAIVGGAAPEIVGWIFGPAFSPAGRLLSLLVFGTLAVNLISVTTAILTAAGHPRWTLVLTGPLVPLAVVSHFYVIPRFGALGAAFVTTSLAVFGAFLSVFLVKFLCQIPTPRATFLRASLASIAAYSFAHFWPTPGPFVLVKLGVIGLLVLFPLLFLEGLKGGELALLRDLFGWPESREEIVEED